MVGARKSPRLLRLQLLAGGELNNYKRLGKGDERRRQADWEGGGVGASEQYLPKDRIEEIWFSVIL